MALFLMVSERAAHALQAHAEAGYPEEVCGFLVGDGAAVREARAAANGWGEGAGETRHNRFAIAPEEYLEADVDARARGLDIVGFYHSHPDAPAHPSRYDLGFARETFPGYLHVIVSVVHGRAAGVTGWVLADDGSAFHSVELVEGAGLSER